MTDDVKELLKRPVPDSRFHEYSDSALSNLVRIYREIDESRDNPAYISAIRQDVEEIYKVLGYRASMDLIKWHEEA